MLSILLRFSSSVSRVSAYTVSTCLRMPSSPVRYRACVASARNFWMLSV